MAQGVDGYVHVHMVHTEAVVRPAVDGQAAAEPIGLGINRPVCLRTQRLRETVGRHHRAEHAEFGYGAPELLGRFLRVLHWDNRHPFEARIELYVGLMEPIVVGTRDCHGIVETDDLAVGKSHGRIEHGPLDADVVEKIEPALRPDRGPLVALGRRLHCPTGMEMIQRWKDHAFPMRDLSIRRLHVGDDSRVVLHDVAIAVNNSSSELTAHS